MTRDLELTERDFHRIRELIYQRAGIVLAEHKWDMVYSRVGRRLRHLKLTDFSVYLRQLEANQSSPEWEAFINALTTNLTSFFREKHHFQILADHVANRQGPINIWCAAASTGEEPYSIAMTLTDALGPNADFSVFSTDIDSDALDKARRGVYPERQVMALTESQRKKYFQRGRGGNAGFAKISRQLQQKVQFSQLNLITDNWPSMKPFDAIFCRNVMIYFDTKTQARVLEQLATYMKRDGLFFAGHSESFTYITDCIRLRGQTVYTLTPR